jgi:hypothetical protein
LRTDAGVPALFHTGQTGIGAGLPGGYGIKLRFSDPMLLDDVAADFPEPFLGGCAQSDGPVDLAVKRYYGDNHVLGGGTRNQPFNATINPSS